MKHECEILRSSDLRLTLKTHAMVERRKVCVLLCPCQGLALRCRQKESPTTCSPASWHSLNHGRTNIYSPSSQRLLGETARGGFWLSLSNGKLRKNPPKAPSLRATAVGKPVPLPLVAGGACERPRLEDFLGTGSPNQTKNSFPAIGSLLILSKEAVVKIFSKSVNIRFTVISMNIKFKVVAISDHATNFGRLLWSRIELNWIRLPMWLQRPRATMRALATNRLVAK